MSCAPYKAITPAQADAERMKSKFPDYDLEKLKEGKRLFEANCGNCHGLKNASKKTAEAWKPTVERMAGKINKKEEKLSAEDQALILKYLMTYSKQD